MVVHLQIPHLAQHLFELDIIFVSFLSWTKQNRDTSATSNHTYPEVIYNNLQRSTYCQTISLLDRHRPYNNHVFSCRPQLQQKHLWHWRASSSHDRRRIFLHSVDSRRWLLPKRPQSVHGILRGTSNRWSGSSRKRELCQTSKQNERQDGGNSEGKRGRAKESKCSFWNSFLDLHCVENCKGWLAGMWCGSHLG